jgi:hypothetical protein
MKKDVTDNPRYPHRVVITRLLVPDNPFQEEEDEETDDTFAEDDAFADTDEGADTVDAEIPQGEEQGDEDAADDEETEPDIRYTFPDETEEITHDVYVVLYEGMGRAFTDTTTTGSTKMDYNRRKCSIPVRYDKWAHEILDGDRIAVMIGDVVYDGEVKDAEPDNDRTLIYWERPRVTD